MPCFLHYCIGEDDLGGDDRGHPARIILFFDGGESGDEEVGDDDDGHLTRNSNPTI